MTASDLAFFVRDNDFTSYPVSEEDLEGLPIYDVVMGVLVGYITDASWLGDNMDELKTRVKDPQEDFDSFCLESLKAFAENPEDFIKEHTTEDDPYTVAVAVHVSQW